MLKALAWKEVRELVPFAALGLALEFYLLMPAMHIPMLPFAAATTTIPFLNDWMLGLTLAVAVLLAGVLGLWQTMWEGGRGTFQFLLHRPIERSRLLGGKLLVGISLWVLVTIAPLLVYLLWAATPGSHPSPFDWTMSLWAWGLWSAMPLVYFGAFLSGLRPGRWYGSRFFPLLAGLLAMALCYGIASFFYLYSPLGVALVVLLLCVGTAVAALVSTILWVGATRDFS